MVIPTVALFKVQAGRSKVAFEALVERWAGILVSDGYGVYQQWVRGRQTCMAHLIRRARGLSKRKEPELAWFGDRAVAAACHLSGLAGSEIGHPYVWIVAGGIDHDRGLLAVDTEGRELADARRQALDAEHGAIGQRLHEEPGIAIGIELI